MGVGGGGGKGGSCRSPKMSNVGKFSWPVDTQVQKEKENFAVACLRPL